MSQNAIVSNYVRRFRPNTHQTEAAARFVKKARYQRGAILFHSMGSGKTLTTVYILENYKKGAKWLIILPKGLDSEWTGAFDQFMAGNPDPNELKTIKQNTTFLSYKELMGMVLDTTKIKTLCDLFTDSYVVCDEAHRLLTILRSQPQQSEEDENVGMVRPLDRAFSLASRILLVTGTPVQRSFGDLGILVNIVAGDTVSPPSDAMFKQHFGIKSNTFFSNAMSMAGTVSNLIVPTVNNLLSLYYIGNAAIGFLGYGAPPTENGGGFMSTYSTVIYSSLAFMQCLSRVNREYNKIDIDAVKIAKDLGPYISYYDALKDISMLAKTPEKTIIDRKLPMTDFQMLQFVSMAHDAGTSSLTELKIVSRIVESDKIGASIRNVDAVEDFIRLGRVVGNLSIDNLAFTTERIKFNGDQKRDLKEYNYRAVFRPDCPQPVQKSNKNQEPVFLCPKYDACLREMVKLRKIITSPKTYMPVVYSCFDKYGFQTFSAFLTSLAIPHLVVHPDDDILHRNAVLTMAKGPTMPWPIEVTNPSLLDPLCVIIHPTLTEGLSFSYNPAIFVLEMPFGYGVQEQIYARVVRTFSDQDVMTYGLSNQKRFPKTVYQYSTCNGYSISLARTGMGQDYGLTDLNFPSIPIEFQRDKNGESHWAIFYEGTMNFFPKKEEIMEGVDLNVTNSVFSKEIDKKMADYRVIYYPTLKFFFQWVQIAPLVTNLINEPRLGKSNKDFVTQYLEDFKFGADQTPDQWAFKINTRQAFDIKALTTALSSDLQKDANAMPAPPLAVPFDIKVPPKQTPTVLSDDILDCRLYDPAHPNDTMSCNLQPMSIHDTPLTILPEEPAQKRIEIENKVVPVARDEEMSTDPLLAEDESSQPTNRKRMR